MSDRPATTILVVDDEALVRRTMRRALEREGYGVLVAESGTSALAVLATPTEVTLVISDVMMDDMVGPEFARRALDLYPDLIFLFMSGETPENLPEVGIDKARTQFLEKPFRPQQLTDKVREVLST